MALGDLDRNKLEFVLKFVVLSFSSVNGDHIYVKSHPASNTVVNFTENFSPLLCIISGNVDLDIQWRYKGRIDDLTDYFGIVKNVNEAFGIYNILSQLHWKEEANVNFEKRKLAGGVLVASAANNGHTATCNDATLTVQWPPTTANIAPTTYQDVNLGEELTLACSSQDKGNPLGGVVWTLNNIIQTDFTIDNLTIASADSSHSGNWACYYRNLLGTSNPSPDLGVRVIWKATQPTMNMVGTIHVLHEGEFSLSCGLDINERGNPTGNVIWTLNGTDQPQYTDEVLRIENFTEANHAGSWRCLYRNIAGNGQVSEPVIVSLGWLPWPAQLEVYTSTMSGIITLNSSLTLNCSTENKGNPPGVVKWNRKGYTQNIIVLETVNKSHTGQWKCWFEYTRYRWKGDPKTKNINVKWKPGESSIHVSPHNRVLRGEYLSLTCDAQEKGNPVGSVVWTLNDTLTSYLNNPLMLNDVTFESTGQWRCNYNNNAGEGQKSEPLQVSLGWPPSSANLRVNSTSGMIKLNSTLTISCSSSDKGNPTGTVNWIRNQMSITELVEETIYVNAITRNDTGKWECYFSNIYGNGSFAHQHITVQWNVSSDDVIFSGPEGNVKEGDKVTLNFSLSDPGNPPAKPTWYHNDTKQDGEMFKNFVVTFDNIKLSQSGTWACSASNGFSGTDNVTYTLRVMPKPPEEGLQIWVYIIIAVVGAILVIVIIVIIVVVTKKKKTKKSDTVLGEHANDQYAYNNTSFDAKTGTGHYDASKTNAGAEDPVYSAVSKGKPLAPIADGAIYTQVELSKKTSRQSMKGLPMSKKAIDRIIFHKKDGYVNMIFQVRKKFTGDIEIAVCRVGDQSCTSKVSKQHGGASKDVVMVLPIEDSSPDNYSIHIKFIERGQVTQTVDLTYPYNKNAVNVTVLNNVYGTNGSEMPENSEVNKPKKKKKVAEDQTYEDVERDSHSSQNDRPTNVVSPSYADVEVEGVPSRPPRQIIRVEPYRKSNKSK